MNPRGHATVFLGGRELYAHRLVMELWLGRPLDPGDVIHHRDGNKLHNCPPNLEITSHAAHTWLDRHTLPLVGYCDQCGQAFHQRHSHHRRQHFCSQGCWRNYRDAHFPGWRRPGPLRQA